MRRREEDDAESNACGRSPGRERKRNQYRERAHLVELRAPVCHWELFLSLARSLSLAHFFVVYVDCLLAVALAVMAHAMPIRCVFIFPCHVDVPFPLIISPVLGTSAYFLAAALSTYSSSDLILVLGNWGSTAVRRSLRARLWCVCVCV